MSDHLEGRSIVVTGGTGALGKAVVHTLVSEGAMCHVPCRRQQDADAMVSMYPHAVQAQARVDMTDEQSVFDFFAKVAEKGPLWASVHLVGGFAYAPILETTLTDFKKQLDMNAVTAFLCSREAVRHFRAGGQGGRILNVAARPALEPRTGSRMVAYTASKAAVAALSQSLGEEMATEGIWVNAIAPSIMDTAANRTAMPKANFDQWVKVEEVAATVAFLVSPDNACIRSGLVPVYGAV